MENPNQGNSLDEIINKLIDDRIDKIEARILEKVTGVKDETVGVEEAMRILQLKRSTLYNLKNQRKIPCFKIGKRLLFSRRELMNWKESGRVNVLQ